MRYEKPSLFVVGSALACINASLSKDESPMDSILGHEYPTGPAAYEADE